MVPRPDGSAPVWGPANDNAVAASISAYHQRPDIVWREPTGVEPSRIALGWPPSTPGPLAPRFAELVRELARVTAPAA